MSKLLFRNLGVSCFQFELESVKTGWPPTFPLGDCSSSAPEVWKRKRRGCTPEVNSISLCFPLAISKQGLLYCSDFLFLTSGRNWYWFYFFFFPHCQVDPTQVKATIFSIFIVTSGFLPIFYFFPWCFSYEPTNLGEENQNFLKSNIWTGRENKIKIQLHKFL